MFEFDEIHINVESNLQFNAEIEISKNVLESKLGVIGSKSCEYQDNGLYQVSKYQILNITSTYSIAGGEVW